MGLMNWKKVKDAEVYGRGSYLPPDEKFLLEFQKMYTIKTRSKGNALIAEFLVRLSSTDDVPVGATKTWYQGLQDEDIAFSSIKEFMLELLGTDQSDKAEMREFNNEIGEVLEECTDEKWKKIKAKKHPLHGRTIGVKTVGTKTKKDADFTRHEWKAWDGEDDESFDF